MEILEGVIERITYVNEENGFTVMKVKVHGFRELVTAVGSMAAVNIGADIVMHGEWRHDSRYGKQFSVQQYKENLPVTLSGIERYLGSGIIKGIGPSYAAKMVRYFKERTLDVIENEPDSLLDVDGIGPVRLGTIKQAWQDQKHIRNVMLFLQDHGVSVSFAVKIFKQYGNESIKVVSDNPYRLADDIWGIGFRTADKIARNLGFNMDSPQRCRSGIIYVLNEATSDGHCFLRYEELVNVASQMLGVDIKLVENCIDDMTSSQDIIIDKSDCVYLPAIFHCESGTAKRIHDLTQSNPGLFGAFSDIGVLIAEIGVENEVTYDPVQLQAIETASQMKFMVMTGGPGTGKTTTTKAIIKVFQKMGLQVLLAAPTGRAAKRLAEVTGTEAKTIHRMLEFKPGEGYRKNADDQLDCDVVIIDEASMIDIVLMYNLLKAIPDHARVVLVGDADQLPPVGAGNVLKDVMGSGVVEVIRLETIFRQAQGSDIIMNAHRVNNGEFPRINGGKDSDFFFIEEEDPVQAVEKIKELCVKRLSQFYSADPMTDIQVLCPMLRGEVGTQNLNVVLQDTLNPSECCLRRGGVEYRIGDKVMQIKNNYDKGVFNGDMGIIADVDDELKTMSIRFDGTDVAYDFTELDEVVLAYAVTVHKSQGSEYPIVIAPLMTQHFIMLQRNLLYTCITRAKKAMVLIGSKKAIAIAVRNNKSVRRSTMLAERLCDCFEGVK